MNSLYLFYMDFLFTETIRYRPWLSEARCA